MSTEEYTGVYPQQTQANTQAQVTQQTTKKALPVIDVGQQLRIVGKASLNALIQHNSNRLYRQEKQLVRLEKNDDGTRAIVALSDKELLTELTHAADFVRKTKDGEKPVPPPSSAIRYIQGAYSSLLRFKIVERIVTIPQIRPDESILQAPGYDSDTRLYYDQSTDMQRCTPKDNPTKEDALESLTYIEDYFGEFSYASASDKANLYGLLLTPFLRTYLNHNQHILMALLDAANIGEGKTLLTDCLVALWTGGESTTLPLSESETEQRKATTTTLDTYPTVAHIDNIDIVLKSAQIARMLSNYYWSDRYLGGNRQARLPNNAVWIATGNQIKVKDDMLRRVFRIRLVSGLAKPYERPLEQYRHPHLLEDVQTHRPELIGHCLTIIRYWFTQNKPRAIGIPDLATFTAWARTIGGILQCVGIDGFLRNLDDMRYEMDSDSGECEAFYSALLRVFGNTPFKSVDLLSKLRQTIPLFAHDETPSELSLEPDDPNAAKKVGKWLTDKKDKPFGYDNIVLKRVPGRSKAVYWHMESKPHAHIYNDENMCSTCNKSKTDIEKPTDEKNKKVQKEVNTTTNYHQQKQDMPQNSHTSRLNNGGSGVSKNASNGMEHWLAEYDGPMPWESE